MKHLIHCIPGILIMDIHSSQPTPPEKISTATSADAEFLRFPYNLFYFILLSFARASFTFLVSSSKDTFRCALDTREKTCTVDFDFTLKRSKVKLRVRLTLRQQSAFWGYTRFFDIERTVRSEPRRLLRRARGACPPRTCFRSSSLRRLSRQNNSCKTIKESAIERTRKSA